MGPSNSKERQEVKVTRSDLNGNKMKEGDATKRSLSDINTQDRKGLSNLTKILTEYHKTLKQSKKAMVTASVGESTNENEVSKDNISKDDSTSAANGIGMNDIKSKENVRKEINNTGEIKKHEEMNNKSNTKESEITILKEYPTDFEKEITDNKMNEKTKSDLLVVSSVFKKMANKIKGMRSDEDREEEEKQGNDNEKEESSNENKKKKKEENVEKEEEQKEHQKQLEAIRKYLKNIAQKKKEQKERDKLENKKIMIEDDDAIYEQNKINKIYIIGSKAYKRKRYEQIKRVGSIEEAKDKIKRIDSGNTGLLKLSKQSVYSEKVRINHFNNNAQNYEIGIINIDKDSDSVSYGNSSKGKNANKVDSSGFNNDSNDIVNNKNIKKLFIIEINHLEFKYFGDNKHHFIYKNGYIYQCQFFGTLIELDYKSKHVQFKIDDSTEFINCILWTNNKKEYQPLNLGDNLHIHGLISLDRIDCRRKFIKVIFLF
ncbi:hypothetical protein K502DRAFT_324189 [Neoconidiobolus thromboides FSU 785]|nr:hypothetical protein K502DRAFT_324189 [Neoconidiobolus thromboides FSU 785]